MQRKRKHNSVVSNAFGSYLVEVLNDLHLHFDDVSVIFPDRLQAWPYRWEPDLTFLWSPVVDGERVLLRYHMMEPKDFGSPFSRVIAPKIEFSEPNLWNKSLFYRNSVPHTYPVDARKLDRFSITHDGENIIHKYPWIQVCWHYPYYNNECYKSWSDWLDKEWGYEERLGLTFEESCDWVRAYIGWRELGEWQYGGIQHIPDLERIAYDRKRR